MNSQNSSEPERIKPIERTVDANCEIHGPYKAKQLAMAAGLAPITMPCAKCSEERREKDALREIEIAKRARMNKVATLFHRSGIPVRFAERTLDNYTVNSPGQKRALQIARNYVDSFATDGQAGMSLVLAGKPGTGKTHIACGVGAALMQELRTVQFMTVLQALRHIKQTYRKDSEKSEDQAISDLLAPDLLILDEIGAQIGSEHEKMLMFEVINERYQSCRSTILISNLTGDELTEFLGDRVMDRFRENGAVVAFDWTSHRGQRALS